MTAGSFSSLEPVEDGVVVNVCGQVRHAERQSFAGAGHLRLTEGAERVRVQAVLVRRAHVEPIEPFPGVRRACRDCVERDGSVRRAEVRPLPEPPSGIFAHLGITVPVQFAQEDAVAVGGMEHVRGRLAVAD